MANVGVQTVVIDQVENKQTNKQKPRTSLLSFIFAVPGKPPRPLGDGSYTLRVEGTQLRLLGAALRVPQSLA